MRVMLRIVEYGWSLVLNSESNLRAFFLLFLGGGVIVCVYSKKRCHYCDFPIDTIGHGRSQIATDKMRRYVDTLLLEVEVLSKLLKAIGFDPSTHIFNTVYFGGGTPSLLPAVMLEQVIRSVQENLGQVCPVQTEMTLEIDPGTFDRFSLSIWRRLGFNRYSVGVQSLDEVCI